MFQVLKTFLVFLFWYSFFIIAFGLGFYIMLHNDLPGRDPSGDEYYFFNYPWLTLVKTSTMFVGEIGNHLATSYVEFLSPNGTFLGNHLATLVVYTFPNDATFPEFSDIPIDIASSMSPLAYSFLLAFVFLIVVVLMNLLNGLAVSDTGKIREQVFNLRSKASTEGVGFGTEGWISLL